MNLETFKSDILPIKNKLFRVALRITGNPQEAEDVVQETLIKVWEQRDELAAVRNIEAWCMQLTKNRSIDKRRLRFNQNEGLEVAYGLSSSAHTPDKQAELSDNYQQIQKLMHQLPEKQRVAMQLRDVDGFSYQEISDTLEMPLAQVKSNIFRARKSVRNKLTALWTTH
ncbi:MAG: RNA polymerase sigma factor [Mameliella sp.]|nr:RNA polymerase sigma factor [Phaeodactylibacter sp.]NRA50716.1 RNA polymerase sigma factor [Phaeodactylibacter sp.]